MAVNTMDTERRTQVNRAAVMQTISENKQLLYFMKENPNLKDVCLNEVIYDLPDDPDVEIMRDYIQKHPSERIVIKNFEADTYTDKPKDIKELNAWGTNVLVDVQSGNTHDFYFAYSGTAMGEGVDNGEGMYTESTAQQRKAADYFDKMAEKYAAEFQNGNVTVVGHSKGGNKAMYTTMAARHGDLIDSCVALDGQGFSNEALEAWQSNPLWFEQQQDKIILVAGENDYVHAIANQIAKDENLYYLSYDPNEPDLSKKKMFMSYHEHRYLFRQNEDGSFTSELMNETGEGEIPQRVKDFFKYYMTLSPYEKRDTAPGLIELMWGYQSPDGVDPDKVSTLLYTFFELGGAPKETGALLLAVVLTLSGADRIEDDPVVQKLLMTSDGSNYLQDLLITASMVLVGRFVSFPLKVAGKTYSAVLAFFRILEKREQQKYREIYAAMADNDPEFTICPEILTDYASRDDVARVGNTIADAQRELNALADESVSPPGVFQILSDGVDPFTIQTIVKLNEGIAIAKRDIKALDDSLRKAIDLLENVKETLNGTIGYMSNTGREFEHAENTVTNLIKELSENLKLG